jgi:hypothetical protein
MTGKGSVKFPWITAALIILGFGTQLACAGEKVARMSKEELNGMLGKPEVIVLDMRAGSDWTNSDQKVLGAVREDPNEPAKSWAEKYPKDKAVVLYCA